MQPAQHGSHALAYLSLKGRQPHDTHVKPVAYRLSAGALESNSTSAQTVSKPAQRLTSDSTNQTRKGQSTFY